jgi:hypothetical protein
MANTQLVANMHSGIYKSMLASGKANPFLYSADASAPNVSRQLYKINPNQQLQAAATARTTLEFNVPKSGFLTGCYLKFGVTSTNWAGNKSSELAGAECVEEVSIQARGRPLRKSHDLGLIWDAIDSAGEVERQNRINCLGAEEDLTTDRTYYVDVGRALGFNQASQLAFDTLFVEDLTISVTLRAIADGFQGAGAAVSYTQAHCYMDFSQLEAADYDVYRSEQYSASQPTKTLAMSWEKETTVDAANSATAVRTNNIDIKQKGLVHKTVFCLSDKTESAAGNRNANNTIIGVKLYANGQIVYECDDVHVLAQMLQKNNFAVANGNNNVLTDAKSSNVYCIDFSQMQLPNHMQDKLTGALNTNDLSSVYLAVEWKPAAANAYRARVAHSVYVMQSVDGASGFVSSSARE